MPFLVALVALLLAMGCCAAPAPPPPQLSLAAANGGEAAVLLQLRDAFANWGDVVARNGMHLVGWAPNATADVCGWSLVSCDEHGRVAEL